jgi:hypothetical protein
MMANIGWNPGDIREVMAQDISRKGGLSSTSEEEWGDMGWNYDAHYGLLSTDDGARRHCIPKERPPWAALDFLIWDDREQERCIRNGGKGVKLPLARSQAISLEMESEDGPDMLDLLDDWMQQRNVWRLYIIGVEVRP